ncbi:histidine phosphatase family protein [Aestuariicoccus sp. MJ-SS9]|uniref:histidine phosphatase family protein n=1 Tax=Aestuariicoccus sp. MJ-SS9 TaxID=3079855 RepID=UPI002910183F|nr:histidine phosphatase family protein [Aestuariicoccus sp. MJ-SS9]MDU8911772.1 histidine phosphatase family protein [Aestuariicoccus sp. MJ-SS9]
MSHVTLVRHGQANSHNRTEGGYDRLSDLGWQQSRWLGAHFRDSGEVFARVYCGTLRRHRETAEGIAAQTPGETVVDPRLNELEYFNMSQALAEQHGIAIPTDREEFVRHLPQLFTHWRDGRLEGVTESFDAFEARVREVVHDIAGGAGRALVVTSGGLIGMAMRVTMGLDIPALCHVCLSIMNTSVHRWQPFPTGLALTQFNAVPHLETVERQLAQTHI